MVDQWYPNGSKSGPIFGNLYAMARWTRTQELVPPSFLNLVSHPKRLADVRTGTRRTRKEKEGLFPRQDKEKDTQVHF